MNRAKQIFGEMFDFEQIFEKFVDPRTVVVESVFVI